MKNRNAPKFTQSKMAEQISRNLSVILLQKVKDPRLGMININDVKLSKDNSHAKVYFSIIGTSDKSASKKSETEQLLNKMAGFLRTELASKLDVRHVPNLKFFHDELIEAAQHLESLFEQNKKDSHE